MKPALRVLVLEDSEDDATLLLRELRRGFDAVHKRVQTADGMREALEEQPWDVIVSDYSMPRFSAPEAFRVLSDRGLDVPFLIVSGTVGEETAVDAMRLGVHDYLLKGKLTRLIPAIERELRESEGRRKRREAEAELRESEARYRALFESSPLPMWVYDVQTLAFLAVNDAAVEAYGYSREEFAALSLADIRPAEDVPAVQQEIALGGQTEGTWRHRTKDGRIRVVEIRAHDFVFEGRAARLILVNDITERTRAQDDLRKAEHQLRQAQKMEAVGRLAGGVAHDFNNVLSVILSYCDLILGDEKNTGQIRSDLGEIRTAAVRAAELTKQLLLFSRHQIVEPKVFDLARVVVSMEKMLQRLLGADVELNVMASGVSGRIVGDPGQIEQVVMNLAVNARDAMALGGKLTIEVKNVTLDDDYARDHHDVTPGPHVMLAATDTGVGMDRATQARIFEPFFTTKETGKGTGLGLSTVFGIVRQARGHIWVYSEPGQGSTFKVYFPRTSAAEEPRSRPPASASKRGSETILIVEDDAQLRTLTGTILRSRGYVALDAATPAEALQICESHAGKIHLLLTDVIMPKMSGPQLAERVAALRPGIRILFMSGYTDDAIVAHGVLESGVAFIQKPITPDAIATKVREVLRAKQRSGA